MFGPNKALLSEEYFLGESLGLSKIHRYMNVSLSN